MVILLDGSSSMGRNAIAEAATLEHPEWQHLALEVIEQASPPGEKEDFHLQVIKKCAEELSQSGMHLILTMPGGAPQHASLAGGLKPDCITVHLGKDEDGEFDYVIDPKTKSVTDVSKLLHAVMTIDQS